MSCYNGEVTCCGTIEILNIEQCICYKPKLGSCCAEIPGNECSLEKEACQDALNALQGR